MAKYDHIMTGQIKLIMTIRNWFFVISSDFKIWGEFPGISGLILEWLKIWEILHGHFQADLNGYSDVGDTVI